MKLAILLFSALTLLSCTRKEPKTRSVLDLIENYKKTQEEMGKFDMALKKAGTDEGLQIQINYDKALAKSRLERLKVQLKKLSPETLANDGVADGGGHGGH